MDRRNPRTLKALRWLFLAGLLLAATAMAAAWRHFSQPTVLTVAVGPESFDDADLMAAFGRTLVETKAPVRLQLVPTSGPVASAEKLAKQVAKLAVVRSDTILPETARAIAVLHRDPVAVVVPRSGGDDECRSLRDKTLGVIGPPAANERLLATLKRHYRMTGETRALPTSPVEIGKAIRDRKVDAVMFIAPSTRSAKIAESWSAVRVASKRKLSFVAIEEAEAIAAASPIYESGEIPAGQFGGSPVLPNESVTTLQIDTYLVADRTLPDETAASLTRALFERRARTAAEAPLANLIKAASTDKDATIPVHPGAKLYYDGEESTFIEKYGDWLYYIPLLLGGLGSALLAVLRFLGLRDASTEFPVLSEFRRLVGSIKDARTQDDLDVMEARLDEAVERFATEVAEGQMDQQQMSALSVVVTHLDKLIASRREALGKVELKAAAE